jgi:competence protein ComEC
VNATGSDLRLAPAALTSWAVTASGILWGPAVTLGALVVATALTALAIRRVRDPESPTLIWPAAMAVAAIGALFALSVALRVNDAEHHPVSARVGSTVAVMVVPTESPRIVTGGRVMFRARLLTVGGHQQSGRVLVFASGVGYGDLTVGRPAEFRARVSRPLRRDLTVAVLSATGEPRLGEAGAMHRVAAAVRRDFAAVARSALPGDQSAMLPALVLGDTAALPRDTVDDFRVAGLTHLTAVSGANVTIVCGAVLLSAALVGPRIAVALAALSLIAFVIVVQPSASVLRAASMAAITLLAVVSRRRRQAIPALAATVIVVLIGWPEMAVDVGFALSVLATAALVVIAPVWSERLVARRWPKPLADAVCVAVAAQLVTAPLVAGISGILSVVAVAANLAVAVVIPPITILGTCAAALASSAPDVAGLVVRFTGPALWWLLRVAHVAAAAPGAAVPVPSGLAGVMCVSAAGLAAVVLWRWRWGRVVLAACACCVLAWTAAGR